MNVVRGLEKLSVAPPYPVVTIGNFDGVHLGHRELLKKTVRLARKNDGTATVFTFEPHPLKTIAPEKMPPMLTTFRKKMELIEAFGVNQVVCARFNRRFSEQKPEDFIRDVLVGRLGAREVVVGFDYGFGKGRVGTLESLRDLGVECGFETHVVEPYRIANQLVSSSLIRSLIEQGEVQKARDLLGRHYSIEGEVVRGRGVGRRIGFPTANLATGDCSLPASGVYAARALAGGRRIKAVVNIGVRPTFGEQPLSVEAHLLNYNQDLYGRVIELEFIARVRGEIKFNSANALAAQIRSDVETAGNLLETVI
ncbi:MAG: bifunctional riboflavin kinase/FAD synthetase [Candidatus Nitrohelix vancouverensis]|uniref:Riboflavin biosynthesis protein n=1 Tax=Candidatus Nitrohelix vancouverensis TaxID=2705534 RepID=A0A7T0C0U5_9BACT|nr:MAG: bifunctional riboflavin kinase/FAD synthetase [Candidatus Nitrohelix vancouverensis]